MKRYDDRILARLLDRYEGSLLYEGRNQVQVSIAVKLTRAVLPEYFDETCTEYTVIDEQLTALEQEGLIRLDWGRTSKHIIERCILNVEAADRAYARLHRTPKREKEQKLSAMLSALQHQCPAASVQTYLQYIEQRLQEGKSVRAELDLDEPESFRTLCILVDAIEQNAEECFLRELSVRTFRDSKVAEQYMGKAVSVLRRYSERIARLAASDDMSDEDILAEYNVYRNPSWLLMKGSGQLVIDGMSMALSSLPLGFGIAGADVEKLSWDPLQAPRRVLTIENLTSFHRWRDRQRDTLCIYLGGFANRYRRTLLMQLQARYPDAEYVHFGDIDCGGFLIWKALCEGTGISFGLAAMDEATYLRFCGEGRPLTEHDRRTLDRMKADPFFAGQCRLFDRMLSTGMKLEQECIEL